MEVSAGEVYFFDYQSYSQLHMALEVIMEKNANYSYSLVTRIPPRRLVENLDISQVAVYWMTDLDETHSVSPNLNIISDLIKLTKQDSKLNCIIFDGLEMIKDEIGELETMQHINQVSDLAEKYNCAVIFCLNSLAFSPQWVTKLKLISKSLKVNQEEHTDSSIEVSESSFDKLLPGNEIELEIGLDGNPRLALLVRLPKGAFSRSVLVKRILQWRRMGLDVSEIEPALTYSDDKAYELYRLVENKVRRAVELDRFIHANLEQIPTTDLAVDIFRLRQLTGLSDLEKKYYSLAD